MKGAHAVLVVYDDSATVPLDVSSITGVTSFGAMLRRRERLSTLIGALAEAAGLAGVLHPRSPGELASVADVVRGHAADTLYLLLPSHLAPTVEPAEAALFLKKLRYLTEPVALWQRDRLTGACLIDRDGLLAYLAAEAVPGERDRQFEGYAERLSPVDDALGLADLRELATALEYLSGSFSARHFNQVSQDRHYVVKRSRDRDKIRREYRFFGHLPEAMQPYFVQPFDFREEAEGASYRMRRLFVPDLAVQWVHRAFTQPQFAQLVSHLFHFVDDRPRRRVGRVPVQDIAEPLYVGKVASRLDALLALPGGREVDATLMAGGLPDGVRGIERDFLAAFDRISRRRRDDELAVTHGDLGFSNILYSPSTQSFQLIDPRGADEEEEIYSDAYYDVAKLSHSVLGSYDFIVAGLYELSHAEDLTLSLALDHETPEELRAEFVAALERHGFDVDVVRVCEASLFLSMLPLHIDAPKRVTAFALRARDILAEPTTADPGATRMINAGKVLVLDVDGTLCPTKGEGETYAGLAPYDAMVRRLRGYREDGYYVILQTSRNMRTYDGNVGLLNANTLPELIEWLARHEVPYDEIHVGKPWAGHEGFYVDDRAVRPAEFLALSAEEIAARIARDAPGEEAG